MFAKVLRKVLEILTYAIVLPEQQAQESWQSKMNKKEGIHLRMTAFEYQYSENLLSERISESNW